MQNHWQFFRNLPPLFIYAEASSGNQGIIIYKQVDLPTSCLLPLHVNQDPINTIIIIFFLRTKLLIS